ncbi:carbohydrate-binding protein [Deinococcus pimensis]|uniref:carbohydrate-binding protein n=1 Tax=Deinococcus pimensis TaxID=309888 RepID=UPI00048606C9|nr:carbohydrate-binding protein [Deinococcus pimensis]
MLNTQINSAGDLIVTLTDGSVKNAGPSRGTPGKGIALTTINDAGDLILTLTDNTQQNAGRARGRDGTDGLPGTPGTVRRVGDAAPDNAVGRDGDQYERSNGDVFVRENGVYVYKHNLKGQKGDQGEPGLKPRGVWSAATTYAVNDSVKLGGSTFRALQTHSGQSPSTAAPPVDTAYWEVVAARGTDGVKGDPGLVPRGAWSATTTYAVNDTVKLNGSTFRALQAHTNQSPSTAVPPVDTAYWEVLAARGADGTAGTPGANGNAFPRGTGGTFGVVHRTAGTVWANSTPATGDVLLTWGFLDASGAVVKPGSPADVTGQNLAPNTVYYLTNTTPNISPVPTTGIPAAALSGAVLVVGRTTADVDANGKATVMMTLPNVPSFPEVTVTTYDFSTNQDASFTIAVNPSGATGTHTTANGRKVLTPTVNVTNNVSMRVNGSFTGVEIRGKLTKNSAGQGRTYSAFGLGISGALVEQDAAGSGAWWWTVPAAGFYMEMGGTTASLTERRTGPESLTRRVTNIALPTDADTVDHTYGLFLENGAVVFYIDGVSKASWNDPLAVAAFAFASQGSYVGGGGGVMDLDYFAVRS